MERPELSEEDYDLGSDVEQQVGEDNYGFKPLEEPEQKEEKKRKREESEASKQYKKEIIRILSKYPDVQLRTSKQIMDRLEEMPEEELLNVRDNCIADLQEIRGSPAASFLLFGITQPVDWKMPGYTECCLRDEELLRSVDLEIINTLGDLGNRMYIFFRLLNNAYSTWRKNKGEDCELDHAKRSKRAREEGDGEEDHQATTAGEQFRPSHSTY